VGWWLWQERPRRRRRKRERRACGRPVWRQILFASKKTQSIIILNALTVVYGTHISFGLILACVCSFPFRSIDVAATHTGGGVQGHRGRS
jgi:hypothetical protein